MQYTLNLSLFRDRHADWAPAAVGALLCQLLQLDVQRCEQQDGGWCPGVSGQPLPAQQSTDRWDTMSLIEDDCFAI